MEENNLYTVRKAGQNDSYPISQLCGQLGYPVQPEYVELKLQEIIHDDEHDIFVAEVEAAGVVGWVHVFLRRLLYYGLAAEIGGLVVKDGYRKKRIGKALMQSAEYWAKEKGCEGVVVRSNETRKEAHVFYQGVGYDPTKKQHVFYKEL